VGGEGGDVWWAIGNTINGRRRREEVDSRKQILLSRRGRGNHRQKCRTKLSQQKEWKRSRNDKSWGDINRNKSVKESHA